MALERTLSTLIPNTTDKQSTKKALQKCITEKHLLRHAAVVDDGIDRRWLAQVVQDLFDLVPIRANKVFRVEEPRVLQVLHRVHSLAQSLLDQALQKIPRKSVVQGQVGHVDLTLGLDLVVDLGADFVEVGLVDELPEDDLEVLVVFVDVAGDFLDLGKVDLEDFGELDEVDATSVIVELVLDLSGQVLGRDVFLAIGGEDDF